MTGKDVLGFRVIGGLKGRDSTCQGLSFGNPSSPYKAICPAADGAVLSIMCDRDLAEDEFIYPVTDEEAEEYARDEHEVDIPIAEWQNAVNATLNIGEFLVCRSPDVIRRAISPRTSPQKDVDQIKPVALFN